MSKDTIKNKKILIAAGGTGGHVFPGISIAHEFQQRGYDVEWLGTEIGLESRLVPVNGIKLNYFVVQGVRGRGLIPLLCAPYRIVRSVISACSIVKYIKPDLVVGMGGFVAGPVGMAAFLSGIPVVIHEQNAVAGTTNRVMSRLAKRVLSAFPTTLERAEVVGNPVRVSLENLNKASEPSRREVNVLVIGGSRGARALNMQLPKSFVAAGVVDRIHVRHQCGSGREIEANEAYEGSGINVDVSTFIDDMDEAMQWADLMVCRAGALTVSEIAVVGLPSILVPYPYAIDDHQTQNARYLANVGAAEIVQESEFSDGKLIAVLRNVINNRKKMNAMGAAAKNAGKKGVAKQVVDICEEVIK